MTRLAIAMCAVLVACSVGAFHVWKHCGAVYWMGA